MEAPIFLVERPLKRPGSRQRCPTGRLQMLSPAGLGRKGKSQNNPWKRLLISLGWNRKPALQLARVSHRVAGTMMKSSLITVRWLVPTKGLAGTDGAGRALACPFPLSAYMLARP